MDCLIDPNIEGCARILLGKIASQGGLELIPIRFIAFKDIKLLILSNDRKVWHVAQANQMIVLTANRNMEDEDSLEQVLCEENTLESFPVITIS